jgi:hypothetical protein
MDMVDMAGMVVTHAAAMGTTVAEDITAAEPMRAVAIVAAVVVDTMAAEAVSTVVEAVGSMAVAVVADSTVAAVEADSTVAAAVDMVAAVIDSRQVISDRFDPICNSAAVSSVLAAASRC